MRNVRVFACIWLIGVLSLLSVGGSKPLQESERGAGAQSLKYEVLRQYEYDGKIMDVAFDSYERDGQIEFYPKVVVLAEINEEASKRSNIYYYKVVEIYNPDRELLVRLGDPNSWVVYLSKNGNFIGIDRVVYKEPWDPYNSDVLESDFTVYDDKGRMVWKKTKTIQWDESVFQEFSTPIVSPKNGAVFLFLGPKVLFYSSNGVRTSPMNYSPSHFAFPDHWEYIAIGVSKPERKVALLDSLANTLWEKSIEADIIHQIGSSSSGSYLFASVYTQQDVGKRDQGEKQEGAVRPPLHTGSGYLFSQGGELLMVLPSYGPELVTFSRNERHFLVKYNSYLDLTRSELGDGCWIEVFDTGELKGIFRKSFPDNVVDAAICDNGHTCVITSRTPPVSERWETLPSRTLTIYFFDNKGDLVGKTGGIETKEAYKMLGWNGVQATIACIEKETGSVSICSVEGGE